MAFTHIVPNVAILVESPVYMQGTSMSGDHELVQYWNPYQPTLIRKWMIQQFLSYTAKPSRILNMHHDERSQRSAVNNI